MASPTVLTELQAVDVIRQFYLCNNLGYFQFALEENPKALLEYRVSTLGKKIKGELCMLTGDEGDWIRLKALHWELEKKGLPIQEIRSLAYNTFKGSPEESEFPLVVVKLDPPKEEVKSKKFLKIRPIIIEIDIPKPQVDLKGRIFQEDCEPKEENRLVVAECLFKKDLIVKNSAYLTKTVVQKAIFCKGKFIADQSDLQDVTCGGDTILTDTHLKSIFAKGSVKWENRSMQKGVSISAGGEVSLTYVTASDVTSANGSVAAKDCLLKKVRGVASFTLKRTSVEEFHMILGEEGRGYLALKKNSKVNDLVIEDLEKTVAKSRAEGPFISKNNPPTFHFPDKNSCEIPPEGAYGRIEGQPYKYLQGRFIKGAEIIIEGGIIGNVTFKNCEKGRVHLSKGAQLIGKVYRDGHFPW